MFIILKADIVDDENNEKCISIKSNKMYFYFIFTDFIILIRGFSSATMLIYLLFN